MIYAGVDIAKMDHVIGAVDETGAEAARPMAFKNTEAGFERCVAWLESVAESEEDVFDPFADDAVIDEGALDAVDSLIDDLAATTADKE